MAITFQEIFIRATLMEEILGSNPNNEQVYAEYIASKGSKAAEEIEQMKLRNRLAKSELVKQAKLLLTPDPDGNYDVNELEAKVKELEADIPETLTVFVRDKDGDPCLYDYIIKGFFKNACKNMRLADVSVSKGFTAYKTKIDGTIFIGPRMIKLIPPGYVKNKDGLYVPELSIMDKEERDAEIASYTANEMGRCERPLRASTPQGERVALAASETMPRGTQLEFSVKCLAASSFKLVREWLEYGEYNGLGQWHNSGKGRFIFEEIDGFGGKVIEPKQFKEPEEAPKKKRATKKATA